MPTRNEYDPDHEIEESEPDVPWEIARRIVNTHLDDLPFERRKAVYDAIEAALSAWGDLASESAIGSMRDSNA